MTYTDDVVRSSETTTPLRLCLARSAVQASHVGLQWKKVVEHVSCVDAARRPRLARLLVIALVRVIEVQVLGM